MTVNNSEQAVVREYLQSGMNIVNAASLPARAVGVVFDGLLKLALSSHPAAKEAIEKIGVMIHDSWHKSQLGKTWKATRFEVMYDFEKINISREETSYFLDSVESVALSCGTGAVGTIAKSAFKAAKYFGAQIIAKKSGSIMEQFCFSPYLSREITYRFAMNTPAEGFIRYRYIRGTQNSILFYLELIQKGKRNNWGVDSSQIIGHTPYCTSKAAISAIQEIARQLGAKRIFLHFEPQNPKFKAFIAKQYPVKGKSAPMRKKHFWQDDEIYPIYEITRKSIGRTQRMIECAAPLVASEALRQQIDLLVTYKDTDFQVAPLPFQFKFPESHYPEWDHLYPPGWVPCSADLQPEMIHYSANDPLPSLSEPIDTFQPVAVDSVLEEEEPFYFEEEVVQDFGQNILNFTGQITGVIPAMDQLQRLNEIVQCLAKNPEEAPIQIVSELFRQPVQHVKNILNNPQTIVRNIEHFLQNPAANYMGALAAVGSIMTFMDSVSWVCEFARKPGRGARELVKMPYTVVKSAVKLGVSLIRHPERTSKQLFKSFINMPENTVKRFLRATGLKKKKKHRHEPPPPAIDPKELERLAAKYAVDLPALYCLAREKGFIDPYKTMEEYHEDLIVDWSHRIATTDSYFDFPPFLMELMQQNSFVTLRSFSPKAHPDRPIISPEMILMVEAIEENLQKTEKTFNDLSESSQRLEETLHQVDIERARLSRASQTLGEILQDPDRLKRALLKKLQAKT